MAVTVGPKTYDYVERGTDRYSDEALQFATELCDRPGIGVCVEAAVDRYHGLVLIFDTGHETLSGYHFANAIAGYSGTGPITAAMILSLFGFGSSEDIYGVISKGGDDAYYPYYKEGDS